MGEAKRKLSNLGQELDGLYKLTEAVRDVQKQQAVILSVLMKKAGVTENELKEEQERLDAKFKAGTRNSEPNEVQP
jgi:hypothetical protein